MKSKFLRLHIKDFVKGAIVAVLTGFGTYLTAQIQSGATVDGELLKRVLLSGAVAFIAYLIKNLFTNNHDEFLTPDKK